MNGKVRVVAFVGEEGRDAGRSARSVVVGKLCKGKEFSPIVLLIVAIDSEILFQRLVSPFGLSVSFGVVTGREVELHVQGFP